MLKKKIFIFGLLSLYKILNEIKNELNFDLVFVNCSSNIIKNLDIECEKIDTMLLAFYNNRSFLSKNLNTKNILFLKKEPLKIEKLIEKINLYFLKSNYQNNSKIIIKTYELNVNSKIIKKKNSIIRLTEKEIMLILFLFNKKSSSTAKELQEKIWKQKKELETHTVETHIYRLRKKFENTFNDKFFINSDHNGYSIRY